MTTNVYIDGFNLYYGKLKKNPDLRWLDPVSMCQKLIPTGQHIQRVRYFTARIKPRPGDPGGPQRQDAYLRALGSLPEVSLHYGRFLQTTVRMRSANPPPNTVEVIKTEEKGTDVNIATEILMDASRKDCDLIVLVSNDSDLCGPLRRVKEELGVDIGILNPFDRPSRWLRQLKPSFIKPIRDGVVRASQLPDTVPLGNGAQVHRPKEWV
ncbi:NYN domain-containing protein [Streptomyces sp. NPDC090106]|uniref:NYN domain-containing protein n=1 Tax=Streptomyces sp. NPDC090106 TaxID=3365946 RepID=UPI0038063745